MLCLSGALHITSDPVWQIIDRPGSTAGPAGLIALLLPCNAHAWVLYALLVGLSEQVVHSTSSEKEDNTAHCQSWLLELPTPGDASRQPAAYEVDVSCGVGLGAIACQRDRCNPGSRALQEKRGCRALL